MSGSPSLLRLLDYHGIAIALSDALYEYRPVVIADYFGRSRPIGRIQPASAWRLAQTCHHLYEFLAPELYGVIQLYYDSMDRAVARGLLPVARHAVKTLLVRMLSPRDLHWLRTLLSHLPRLNHLELRFNYMDRMNVETVRGTLPPTVTHLSLPACESDILDALLEGSAIHSLTILNGTQWSRTSLPNSVTAFGHLDPDLPFWIFPDLKYWLPNLQSTFCYIIIGSWEAANEWLTAASLVKGKVLLLARSGATLSSLHDTPLEECEIDFDEKRPPVATQVVLAWAGPDLFTVTFDITADGKKYDKSVRRTPVLNVEEEWKHIHKARTVDHLPLPVYDTALVNDLLFDTRVSSLACSGRLQECRVPLQDSLLPRPFVKDLLFLIYHPDPTGEMKRIARGLPGLERSVIQIAGVPRKEPVGWLNALRQLPGKVLLFVSVRPAYPVIAEFAKLVIDVHPDCAPRASQVVILLQDSISAVVTTFDLDVERKCYSKTLECFVSEDGDRPWVDERRASQVWANLEQVNGGVRASCVADAAE